MATISPSELLGDSLFQVNLLLWMLQPPNGSNIRPILAEADSSSGRLRRYFPWPRASSRA